MSEKTKVANQMVKRVPDFPSVNSDLLQNVISQFKKRSKAIKHKVSGWNLEVSIDSNFERLNFDFEMFEKQIRLSVWEDGITWFRVCESAGATKGWKFIYAFHATLLDENIHGLVGVFEKSLIQIGNKEITIAKWEKFAPNEDFSVNK
ncbi:MAG: hypothetical protein AAGF54_06965 [Pseudomonadota bacterium]